MKATAEKSSTTSATATHAANQPFFAKAGDGSFFAPSRHTLSPAVQMKMTVNQPGDKFEQEADRTADKVMRMSAPESPKEEKLQRQTDERLQKKEKEEDKIQKAAMPEEKLQKQVDEKLQKAPATEEKLQRKDNHGAPAVGSGVQSAIHNKTTGGQPLSSDVRSYMEPRFGADFSNVRVHSDPESASLSNQLSARAFTYQNHVFFSRDQYQPGTSEGKQLLAHELTHTVQQGHSLQRSPKVTTTVTPPPVQRLGVQDALDYFADKAYHIPGFRMLTIVMGFNPINMRSTDRSAANILRALIELVPGGHLITQALDNHGVFNKAGAWVEQKLATLGDIGSDIIAGLKRFIDSLSWTDIFDLGGVWDRAKRIFTDPIGRLISFAGGVVSEILKMVKDAILKPLAALAQGTRGYDLLKAILGEDPITGEPVPRNADTLIGGFMKLIGQEEIWQNIKKGNAVARAWAWFEGALAGLMGFVRTIPRKIVDTITSLTFEDIVTVAGAFTKIVSAFVNIATDFISWGLNQVISLLEILFLVVAPGVMPYIAKAKAAFTTILKNPVAFVGNLVRAGKQGFELFASNILTHLKAALIKWITGPLGDAGVYIPKSFDLIEIVKLVLSVLGLTWQNIRAKLVKIIPEPVLVGLEKTAGILVTLVKDGPAAAWEQIKAELSELKDQLIAQVTQMVTTEVVKAAVVKLVSMLNPAGAVIQAIIAIYNTVTFFIQKIQQIAAVVASFIDSISAIAAGQVANAAKKVEQTMANTLTVIIAFLAKFAGLGNIPEKVVGIVKKIRQPIDKGLDKIVGWLGDMLKKAFTIGTPTDPQKRLDEGVKAGVAVVNKLPGKRVTGAVIPPLLSIIKTRYQLQSLEAIPQDGKWAVKGVVNPVKIELTDKEKQEQEQQKNEFVDTFKPAFGGDEDQAKAFLTELSSSYDHAAVVSLQTAAKGGQSPTVIVSLIRGAKPAFKIEKTVASDYINLHYKGVAIVGGKLVADFDSRAPRVDAQGLAEVKNRSLSLDFLVPSQVKAMGVKGVGKEMFNMAFEHFKNEIDSISALWVVNAFYYPPDGLSDNLKLFILNFGSGDKVAAAKATWTGAMAGKKNYDILDQNDVKISGGLGRGMRYDPVKQKFVKVTKTEFGIEQVTATFRKKT